MKKYNVLIHRKHFKQATLEVDAHTPEEAEAKVLAIVTNDPSILLESQGEPTFETREIG